MVASKEYSDQLLEQWHASSSANVLYMPADPLNFAMIVMGLIVVTWIVAWVIRKPAKGSKMGRDTTLVADAFTDAVEDLVFKGKMSRRTARYWYNRVGKKAEIPDLLVFGKVFKKMHPHRINQKKEEIKYRLGNGLYKTKAKLPKDPPPTIKEDARQKASKFFAKA